MLLKNPNTIATCLAEALQALKSNPFCSNLEPKLFICTPIIKSALSVGKCFVTMLTLHKISTKKT